MTGALQARQDEKIGVLVADIEGNQHSHQAFFRLLKQEHPEIVTIAMTAASNFGPVIALFAPQKAQSVLLKQ